MDQSKKRGNIEKTTDAVATTLTAFGTVGTAALGSIKLIGFTSAGIQGGSVASGMMSSAAISSGGAVAAGSPVAFLQSYGTMAILGPVGCSAIGATYFGFKWIYRNKNKPKQ